MNELIPLGITFWITFLAAGIRVLRGTVVINTGNVNLTVHQSCTACTPPAPAPQEPPTSATFTGSGNLKGDESKQRAPQPQEVGR